MSFIDILQKVEQTLDMIDFNTPQPAAAAAPAPAPTGADPFNPNPPGLPAVVNTGNGPQAVTGAPEYVDVDEMQGGFEPLPPGSYQLKIATVAGEPSKKGDQMVTCTFEVVAGKETGREIRKWYITQPKQDPKTRKWNSRGVADAREDLKKLGQAVPKQFPTNGAAAARIIGMGFQAAGVFTGIVTERSYTSKTETDASGNPKVVTTTEVRVAAPGGVNVTPANNTNPFGL